MCMCIVVEWRLRASGSVRGVTSKAIGNGLGRMHSFLDQGVIVMDDRLLDAAHRVLFAVVGQKQQEYPFLAQLREFLKQYVEARPVAAAWDPSSSTKRSVDFSGVSITARTYLL
jgi:hypothetical protein